MVIWPFCLKQKLHSPWLNITPGFTVSRKTGIPWRKAMYVHHYCDAIQRLPNTHILSSTVSFKGCLENILVLEEETRKRVEGLTVYFSSCCQNASPKNSVVQLFLKHDLVSTFFWWVGKVQGHRKGPGCRGVFLAPCKPIRVNQANAVPLPLCFNIIFKNSCLLFKSSVKQDIWGPGEIHRRLI